MELERTQAWQHMLGQLLPGAMLQCVIKMERRLAMTVIKEGRREFDCQEEANLGAVQGAQSQLLCQRMVRGFAFAIWYQQS